MEVVELTGIPGAIRTLVCAVKGCSQIVTVSIADGGYSWISIQEKNPFNPELNLQDAFFQAAQQAPQRLAIGTAFNGFNDTLATWGTNRVIDQNCGETWIQSFSEIGKFYSSGNQLAALQIATWNDCEEGTSIESGIDNSVFLVNLVAPSVGPLMATRTQLTITPFSSARMVTICPR